MIGPACALAQDFDIPAKPSTPVKGSVILYLVDPRGRPLFTWPADGQRGTAGATVTLVGMSRRSDHLLPEPAGHAAWDSSGGAGSVLSTGPPRGWDEARRCWLLWLGSSV
jgi:hypothetical protein